MPMPVLLVVDPDRGAAAHAARVLRDWTVLDVASVSDAVATLGLVKVDAMIVDVVLLIDGGRLLHARAATVGAPPIFALSATTPTRGTAHAFIVGVLGKPPEERELRAALAAYSTSGETPGVGAL
jgi:DNA-binding response OmpR family regulator